MHGQQSPRQNYHAQQSPRQTPPLGQRQSHHTTETPPKNHSRRSSSFENDVTSSPSNKLTDYLAIKAGLDDNNSTLLSKIIVEHDVATLNNPWEFLRNKNCTALYYACSLGKVDHAMILIQKGVDLYEEHREKEEVVLFYPIMEAAILSGNLELVVILVMCGVPLSIPTQQTVPNTSQLERIIQIQNKYGTLALALDFPKLMESLLSHKIKQVLQLIGDTMAVTNYLDVYVRDNAKFRMKKRENSGTIGVEKSLIHSLSKILQKPLSDFVDIDVLPRVYSSNTLYKSIHGEDPYLSNSTLQLIAQKFNINIAILLPGKDDRIVIRVVHVNNHHESYPTVYLTFNGERFDPLVDYDTLPTLDTETASSAILAALNDPKTTMENFQILLENFDFTKINELVEVVPGKLKTTLLYATCYRGRTDLVLVMIKVFGDSLKLDGYQHSESGSSPLHCVCWRGFPDILAILLYQGADPKMKNRKEGGELPRSLCSSTNVELKKIWDIYDHPDKDQLLANVLAQIETKIFPSTLEVPDPPLKDKKDEIEILSINPPDNPYTIMWSAQLDDKSFHQYDIEISKKIEQAYQSKMTEIKVRINNTDYNINLKDFKQINAKSGYFRNIRREEFVTVEQLCSEIEKQSLENVQKCLSVFDEKDINEVSKKHRCTPLYMACRMGNFEIFQRLIRINGIRFGGPQESNIGVNTPLHVANWNGHLRIVALLLTYVDHENKPGNKSRGLGKEVYTGNNSLKSNAIKNKLELCYAIANNLNIGDPEREKQLRKYWQEVPKTVQGLPPLTLAQQLKFTVDEIPPQYLYLRYLWYEKISSKYKLLDLHTSSCLDIAYQKYLESSYEVKLPTVVPIMTPPQKGQKIWSQENWNVDFHTLVAEIGNNKKILVNLYRPQSWFYRSKQGNLVLLPYKVNRSIGETLYQKCTVVRVIITEGFFWNRTTTKYDVNLALKEVTITVDNQHGTLYPILNELELHQTCNWDPFDALHEKGENNNNEIIKKILEKNDEWHQVANMFHCTVPLLDPKTNKEINQIVKITKLYHPPNKRLYDNAKELLFLKHKDNPAFPNKMFITKLLWHGSGSLHPDNIFNFTGSFDPCYSSVGLWGRGSYFATDASYSTTYAYNDPNGNKIMLLSEVLVGQSILCLENNAIVDVPHPKPTPTDGCYNSVVGYRHGSWNYVLHHHSCALPVYEVEFRTI